MNSFFLVCDSMQDMAHLNTKLLGVDLGEGGQSEGPAMQACAEAHCPLLWIDLGVSQLVVGIGGHDDIGRLDNPPVAVVGLLTIQHELQEAAVELVHSQHGPNAFAQGLQAELINILRANQLHSIVKAANRAAHGHDFENGINPSIRTKLSVVQAGSLPTHNIFLLVKGAGHLASKA